MKLNHLFLVSFLFANSSTRVLCEENLDALLRDADRALGGSSNSKAERQDSDASSNASTEGKATKSASKKSRSKTAAKLPSSSEDKSNAQPIKPTEPAALTPIDPARVSEILAIDIQAQERERLATGQKVSIRMGYANDRIPAVYQAEKDDDTFTVVAPASLKGISIEGTRVAPISPEFGAGIFRGSFFWGATASAAAVQGQVEVQRSGIEAERTTYDYQIFPVDGSLNLGWKFSSNLSLWMGLGYGFDVVRQLGVGETDTFTEVFSGEVGNIGTSWRSESGYEIFATVRQRGVRNQSSSNPTTTRIAGRMVSVGVGYPL